MLGAKGCLLYEHLNNPEKLREMGEDNRELFGYFIIDGKEKVLIVKEQQRQNDPTLKCLKQKRYKSKESSVTPECSIQVLNPFGTSSRHTI